MKLIPANTPDIIAFFKRFHPSWVEWISGTFVVVFDSEANVDALFEELTVEVG